MSVSIGEEEEKRGGELREWRGDGGMLDAETWGSVENLTHVGDRICPGKGMG